MPVPHEYFEMVIGKGFNVDGLGNQCVAGFKHWCKTYLGLDYYGKSICYGGNPKGYAYRIWYNFDSLGLGKYFDKVPSNQMVDGDWAIWNYGSGACPYSHIAMFRLDQGATGVFLGQNQGGVNGVYNQRNISYNGILGALRPKIYHQPAPSGEKVDQILHKGSKVQLEGTYVVKDINVKENTAKITIEGKDYWLSSVPLKEV